MNQTDASATNRIVVRTTDGGINWHLQFSGVTSNLRSVSFVDLNNGWACGDRGVILSTTDGGSTWIRQASSTVYPLNAISFSDVSTGWVAGRFGTILRYSNVPLFVAHPLASQNQIASFNNYPNPFNPSTTISFDLLEKNIFSIKLYNILGQEVKTVVRGEEFSAGPHRILFDASDLVSGVYVGRIFSTDGKYQAFHKMLFVK